MAQEGKEPDEPPPPQPALEIKQLLDAVRQHFERDECQRDQCQQALQAAEQALEVSGQSADMAGVALAQQARGDALAGLERRADAVAAYRAAAEAWARVGDGPGQVQALAAAGVQSTYTQTEETKALLAQALALGQRETLRPLAAATALNDAGELLFETFKYVEAREFYVAALAIQEQLAPDSLAVAESLFDLAWTLSFLEPVGQRADEYFRRAVEIRQRLVPGSQDLAHALMGVAMAAAWRADYAASRDYDLRALEILEALGPEVEWVEFRKATALNNLAGTLADLGDLRAAEEYQRRAIDVQGKITPPTGIRLAIYWSFLGHILLRRGDLDGAEELYRRALSDVRAFGNTRRREGIILGSLGKAMLLQRNLPAAKDFLQQSITILESVQGVDAELADALQSLGGVAWEQGDLGSAESAYARALALREGIQGQDHPEVAAAVLGLATVYANQGETNRALERALRAEQLARAHARLTAQSLSEREALLYSSIRAPASDILLTLTTPQASPTAWDAVVRSRALVLDEMAARHRVAFQSGEPEVARLAQELSRARERLARIVVRGPGDDPKRYAVLLEHTRQEKERAERLLAEKSREFRSQLARAQIGLEEVLRALPPHSALVAYIRYRRHSFSPAQPGAKPADPVPSYLAFVVSGTKSAPKVVPLGRAEEIERLVTRLREQISQEAQAAGRASRRSESAYRRIGVALRRRIWEPIAAHVGSARRVFIVPDAALHLVNFAALPTWPRGYLLEGGPLLHYVSAERDLVPLGSEQDKGVGLLAVGSPAFDETSLFASLRPAAGSAAEVEKPPVEMATLQVFRGTRSACGDFQSMRFEPMPASASETEEIRALWQESRQAANAQARPAVLSLVGPSASEGAVKQQVRGQRVLHLATHGFFLGGRCPSAFDSRADPWEGSVPAAVTGENPLLLAGLALAGANHRQAASPEEEDGILTAEEIAALNFGGVEWAVLSACDTGVGEVKAGEGVLGLRRAFQVAGVKTLIMSLWPVEDEAARHWMRTLYQARFVQGQGTAESARAASLAVLRERRARNRSTHPFYWAGFVAAGDWR